jgi:hypothetical protein
MQPQEFLAAVLPSSGFYCAAELTTKKRQHVFTGDLIGLEEAVRRFDTQGKSTYYALASFKESGSREADNAQFVRAIFMDVDLGKNGCYGTKREAVEALDKFLTDTKLGSLGRPWVVDSGGGLHIYWPLTEDTPIPTWKPVAESVKRHAKQHGFKIDMTVTADAARVLRPPGTLNTKYTPPRPVQLKLAGDIFSLQDIADTLGAAAPAFPLGPSPFIIPGKPPTKVPAVLGGTALKLMQNSATYFKNIMVKTVAGKGCGQLAYYVEHATEDGVEPLWRGLLSIAQKCEDGVKAAARLSAMHPYDEERLQRKWAELKGPYPCVKFDSENPGVCGSCPHWGKITNPLALGREATTETAEKVYAEPIDDTEDIHPAANMKRPTPPRGFSFGSKGGVFQTRSVEVDGESSTKEVMLLPFDFFMVDMLQDGPQYFSRFAAVREKTLTFVSIPSKSMGSKDEVIKTLAAQNVIAAFGAGNDKNLYDYVRSCVGEASAGDTALRIPPTMGWQPDGGFAISDTVYVPRAPAYVFVSERLQNLVNSTVTKGTLGDWQRVMRMLQDKQLYGILTMGAIGFGSPLMRWADDGTPGMVFHACGRQSGAGKSLALALCASVWGSPSQYPVKPTTSERTMLQRAGFLGSLPLCVDEITSNARKSEMEWIPEFVFDFSQGGHKLKGSGASNAELVNDLFWKAISLITSNAPALEHMMGARETSSEGEAKRLLEWRTESKLEWLAQERELLPLLGQNFGVAGRAYAEWLVKNQSKAQEVLAAITAKWRRVMHAEDSERYWTSGCAAVLAGATLAGPGYANIFDFNVPKMFEFLKGLVVDARAIIAANQQNAEDVLNAYTREYYGQLVKYAASSKDTAIFGDGKRIRPDSTKGRVAGRVEYNINPGWVDYYIEINLLKRYCSLRNWSFLEFKRKLSGSMVVAETRKDLLANADAPPMRVNCLRISRLLTDEDPT